MAKGKHAAALFEVINSQKKNGSRDESGALRPPKWWWKGRNKDGSAAGASSAMSAIPPSFTAPASPIAAPPASSSSSPPLVQMPSAASVTNPRLVSPSISFWPADATSAPASASSSGIGSSALGGSRERRTTLQLTYGRVALGALCVGAVIGMAFVIGQRVTHGPPSASAAPIEELRKGKPTPDALLIDPNGKALPGSNGSRSTGSRSGELLSALGNSGAGERGGAEGSRNQPTQQQSSPVAPDRVPVTQATFNGKRIVGMQYVVMQTYPEQTDAQAAIDALAKSGIQATSHQGFWPQRPTWFTVIGTTGWEHTRNNPDYQRYLQTITDVSAKFSGKSRFKAFDPMLFTWKEGKP